MLQVLTNWRKKKASKWMPHWYMSRLLKGWTEKDIEMVRESLANKLQINYELGSTGKGGRCAYRYKLSK